MNKILIMFLFLLLSISVYAREVSSTNQGIANASPGDYIMRSGGEKIILKQADIDYARRQLGLTTTQNTQNRISSSYGNSSSTRSSSSSNDSSGLLIIFLLVILGVIVIIGVCVSNITTTIAEDSGMSEESAKKVGRSAGVLAGTAAAIEAALLLGKTGGIKQDKNHITITHKH